MTYADWTILILFVLSLVWGVDRHLELKDVEKDLRLLLGDFQKAQSLATGHVKVHYVASASAIKTLIRKHFKL